jgi:hypothetical protein
MGCCEVVKWRHCRQAADFEEEYGKAVVHRYRTGGPTRLPPDPFADMQGSEVECEARW